MEKKQRDHIRETAGDSCLKVSDHRLIMMKILGIPRKVLVCDWAKSPSDLRPR